MRKRIPAVAIERGIDYLDALRQRPVDGALIAIVAQRDVEQEGPDWELLTWQQVAELANRAG